MNSLFTALSNLANGILCFAIVVIWREKAGSDWITITFSLLGSGFVVSSVAWFLKWIDEPLRRQRVATYLKWQRVARQFGWLTINEMREDQNPLHPGGELYLDVAVDSGRKPRLCWWRRLLRRKERAA